MDISINHNPYIAFFTTPTTVSASMSGAPSVAFTNDEQSVLNTLTSDGLRSQQRRSLLGSYADNVSSDEYDQPERASRPHQKATTTGRRASSVPTQYNRERLSSPPPPSTQQSPLDFTIRHRSSSAPPSRRTIASTPASRVRFGQVTSIPSRLPANQTLRFDLVTNKPDNTSSGGSLETQSDGGEYENAESDINSDAGPDSTPSIRGILKNKNSKRSNTATMNDTSPDTARTDLSEFTGHSTALRDRMNAASEDNRYRNPVSRATLNDMISEISTINDDTTDTPDNRAAKLANLESKFKDKFGDVAVSDTLQSQGPTGTWTPELLGVVSELLDKTSPLDMHDIPKQLGLDSKSAQQVMSHCRNVQNSYFDLVTAATLGAAAPVLNSMYNNLASIVDCGTSAIGTGMRYLSSVPYNVASGVYNTGNRVVNGGIDAVSGLGSMIYKAPSAVYNTGTNLGSTVYNFGKGMYNYGSNLFSAPFQPTKPSNTGLQTLIPSDQDQESKQDVDATTAANTAANTGVSRARQAPSAGASFGSTLYNAGWGVANSVQNLANGISNGISGAAGYFESYLQPQQERVIAQLATDSVGETMEPCSLPAIDLTSLKTNGLFLHM